MKGRDRDLPDGWRWARLGQVCEINPSCPINLDREESQPTTFVPMAAVDEVSGAIRWPQIKSFVEIKSGYTYFAEGDVLFAKITPCMQNGKHAIARNLIDDLGFGSTEFHIVRPGADMMPEWIHLFLRQPSMLKLAEMHFTGSAGQKRVPKRFLYTLEIPLPPPEDQKRIVAVLNERLATIECARVAAEAQLEAARALPAAYLRAVFEGDEATSWSKSALGQICEVIMGQSPKGTSYNDEGKGVALLNGPTEFGPTYPTPVQWTTAPTRFAEAGDILLCVRGATTGRKNIANKSYCIGRGLAAIRGNPEYADTQFIWFALEIVTSRLLKQTAGSTFPNLPGAKLRNIKIPLPSVEEQRQLANLLSEKTSRTKYICKQLETQIEEIEQLPAAYLRQAFRGEL